MASGARIRENTRFILTALMSTHCGIADWQSFRVPGKIRRRTRFHTPIMIARHYRGMVFFVNRITVTDHGGWRLAGWLAVCGDSRRARSRREDLVNVTGARASPIRSVCHRYADHTAIVTAAGSWLPLLSRVTYKTKHPCPVSSWCVLSSAMIALCVTGP